MASARPASSSSHPQTMRQRRESNPRSEICNLPPYHLATPSACIRSPLNGNEEEKRPPAAGERSFESVASCDALRRSDSHPANHGRGDATYAAAAGKKRHRSGPYHFRPVLSNGVAGETVHWQHRRSEPRTPPSGDVSRARADDKNCVEVHQLDDAQDLTFGFDDEADGAVERLHPFEAADERTDAARVEKAYLA